MKLVVMCALLWYAFGQSSGYVYKRKMCLQYEMKDHSSVSTVMSRRYLFAKMQCMASCMRHNSFNTFNFWSVDGTCELLETSEICLAWNVSQDTTLNHWGRVTHICVSKLTIIGSDNGLSPGRRQAIIWTNAGILLIRTLGTNFSEILGEIH